jgi:extracellular elastinolytic metalloproteinase
LRPACSWAVCSGSVRRYAEVIGPVAAPARSLSAAVACAAALAFPAAAGAAAQRPSPAPGRAAEPKPYLDVRDARRAAVRRRGDESLRPSSAATRRARAGLRRSLGRGAILDVDELTGTPRVVARRGGTLTGPREGDRAAIAAEWVREHLPELGLTRDDLGSLGRPERSGAPRGLETLRWRQHASGIPAFDAGLRVTVTGDGRVLSVAGAPQADLELGTTTPSLGAGAALRALLDDVGAPGRTEVVRGPSGVTRETGFAGGDTASLVVFGEGTSARLGWRIVSAQAGYAAVVDAHSGDVLHRSSLVWSARVFRQYPGAPRGGQAESVDIGPYLAPGATRLEGPNARVWSDVDDDDVADAGEEVAPGDHEFDEFTPQENPLGACDAAHKCSWNFGVASSWETNRRQNAVQVFYFVNRFHDHLEAAPIGFTPADGNLEGGDPVRVHTSDGANTDTGRPDEDHLNNANMFTPPDGTPAKMQMYLWLRAEDEDGNVVLPFRDVNGGDDAAIVYHEYAHGLSGRLVTFADGTHGLGTDQGRAMGEGWSDWYAKDFLVEQFPQDDGPADGDVHMGAYIESVPNSIRSEGLDCPVGSAAAGCPGRASAGRGGYTYGDFGEIDGADDEHANGEIWGQTLWDLRKAVGVQDARALITQGMRLAAVPPSFLDMRDGILSADEGLFGGAHEQALWAVFAERGMGADASETGPVEGFNVPGNLAPAGSLSAAPSTVRPGEPVVLTASMSDPDGTIAEYEWDADGNGSIDRRTTSQTTAFSYAANGTYRARVGARDSSGGRGFAQATVAVTDVTPAPTETPAATPTATPTPTPTVTPISIAPIVRLPGTGRRFSVRFVVECDSACTGTVRLTVSKRVARRLRLGRSRTVASARVRLPAAGRQMLTATLTFKVRRAMRRARLTRIATTAQAAVVDAEAQRGTARRGIGVRSR